MDEIVIYAAGEIHSDWRDELRAHLKDLDVDAEIVGPQETHDRSDSVGEDILGKQPGPMYRDLMGARVNTLRTRVLMQRAELCVAYFGPKYKQWNTASDAGAAVARGDRLVFLAADTFAPAKTLRAASRAMEGGAAGGGARVCYDLPSWSASATTTLWNALSRAARWAAGCFVFTQRRAFEAAGGFDERYYAAEEIALSEALKRQGPFAILSESVVTSSRKLDGPWAAQITRILLSTVATAGGTLRHREALGFWYNTGRGVGGTAENGTRKGTGK